MTHDQNIDSFVVTLDELLRFLDSYQNDLFYIDIDPKPPPPDSRHFEITTFKAEDAWAVLDQVHPGPQDPRITPQARQLLPAAGELAIGMNIQPKHGFGWRVVPPEFARCAWLRFPFMSSAAQFGSLEDAFNFYDPIIGAYTSLGTKIMLILTHQTYGEGAGWNWDQMDSGKWRSFTPSFVAVAERIAQRYGNRIAAYEIWNEGDVEPGNPAAVAIPPEEYAPLLNQAARVIRTYAPQTKIIFGGLATSPDKGANYVKKVKSVLGGRLPVDAIGVHPYGVGAPGDSSIFAPFGSIQTAIDIYSDAVPGIPLWLTEVGALGANDPPYWPSAATYMQNLFRYLRTPAAAAVPVVIWYAWSDAMHVEMKTNGVVTARGEPKSPIYETFFNEAAR